MEIRVEHHTTKAKARAKLEKLLEEMADDYAGVVHDLEQHWEGDRLAFSFRAKGFKVAGDLSVNDHDLLLKGRLPLLAIPFEPRIKEMMTKEARKVFPEKKGKGS